jgi:hypothetical protein
MRFGLGFAIGTLGLMLGLWPGVTARRAGAAAGGPETPAPGASSGEGGTGAQQRRQASQGRQTPGAEAADLEKLRAEYDRLREELFKARVRSQKVADVVYPTRFDVRLRWKGSPAFVIRKARFLMDGAEIWDSSDRSEADDLVEVASRPIKPGPHALTVSLEIRPKGEQKGGAKVGAARLGYTSEHTFAVVAPDKGELHLSLTGDEDGDPPEYEPRLELEVKLAE